MHEGLHLKSKSVDLFLRHAGPKVLNPKQDLFHIYHNIQILSLAGICSFGECFVTKTAKRIRQSVVSSRLMDSADYSSISKKARKSVCQRRKLFLQCVAIGIFCIHCMMRTTEYYDASINAKEKVRHLTDNEDLAVDGHFLPPTKLRKDQHNDQAQSSLGYYDTVRSNVAQYPHLENSTLENIIFNESNVSTTIVGSEFLNPTKDFGMSIEGAKLFLRGCNSYEPPIAERFFCKSSKNKQNKEINFFSSAVGEKYENVLPMYAFFALRSNKNSTVEMVVKNATHFVERKYNLLKWLNKFALRHYGQICVRDYDHDHSKRTKVTNTWRFLEVPHVKAKYTYMADIDIFLTESVLDSRRFQQIDHFKLPYSNMIRPNTTRLTGVMLVDTKRFYTEAFREAQQTLDATGNDEMVLYKLVKKAGHGLPPDPSSFMIREDDKVLASYRPVHGVHLSFNRGPGKRLCQISYDQIRALLLSSKDIHGLLCRDSLMLKSLSSTIRDSYKQSLYNMTVKDGVCAKEQNTIKIMKRKLRMMMNF